jgi:hypothetical protein
MSGSVEVRALAVLLRPSSAILLAMAALIAWAGYLVVVAPDDLRGPYVVLLLCQSFAASTGYATRARRGHFDQVLAGQSSRARFAFVHASMSIVLGAIVWCTISTIDGLGAGGHWPLGFTPKALAAFVYISTLAWALSVPFSRYSTGVCWLIVAIGLAGSGRLLTLRNNYAAFEGGWRGIWTGAGSALVFPPVMVGEPSTPPAVLIALIVLAAATAVAGGVTFISRYGLPLEDVE